MTKPLEQMTVGELRSYAYLAGEVNKDLGHAHPLRWLARQAFDELARRLAEAERRLDRYTRISESGLSLGDHLDCIEQLERMKPVVEAAHCPYCPDQGWYEGANAQTGEGEQVQCQWCYENPNSLFNARNEYEEGK